MRDRVWLVSRRGEVVDAHISLYGQWFVIYAAVQYYKVGEELQYSTGRQVWGPGLQCTRTCAGSNAPNQHMVPLHGMQRTLRDMQLRPDPTNGSQVSPALPSQSNRPHPPTTTLPYPILLHRALPAPLRLNPP